MDPTGWVSSIVFAFRQKANIDHVCKRPEQGVTAFLNWDPFHILYPPSRRAKFRDVSTFLVGSLLVEPNNCVYHVPGFPSNLPEVGLWLVGCSWGLAGWLAS